MTATQYQEQQMKRDFDPALGRAADASANTPMVRFRNVTKRYGAATNVRPFDGNPGSVTEMDALVAYLQILGRLTDAATKPVADAGGTK